MGALEENDGFFIVARAISKSHELFNNVKLVDFKNTNIQKKYKYFYITNYKRYDCWLYGRGIRIF